MFTNLSIREYFCSVDPYIIRKEVLGAQPKMLEEVAEREATCDYIVPQTLIYHELHPANIHDPLSNIGVYLEITNPAGKATQPRRRHKLK